MRSTYGSQSKGLTFSVSLRRFPLPSSATARTVAFTFEVVAGEKRTSRRIVWWGLISCREELVKLQQLQGARDLVSYLPIPASSTTISLLLLELGLGMQCFLGDAPARLADET